MTDSLIGRKLSHYRVLRKIGEGGMGMVYQAQDTRLEREVALKVLPSGALRGKPTRQRFRREALALSHLNHPNIATIYDFDTDQDVDLLVMEMIHGATLRERLKRGPIPGVQAIDVGAQIAEALEFAHGKGVVHRDLKPGNIMTTASGLVKVLDFGLAHKEGSPAGRKPPAASAWLPGSSQAMGTPGYMSPEQVRGLTQDSRTDTFAFGCVLFECLAGERAFAGKTREDVLVAVLTDEPRWSALPEGVPPRVRTLLRSCLEKDQRKRLPQIRDARAELEAILGIRRHRTVRRRAAAPSSNNLPIQGTSFIGRESEIAECRALLGQTRLLTLTGSGGCGKTRLALQVAERSLAEYPDGVWFADLAPVREGARVAQAVASAAGVREEAGTPLLETVQHSLSDKRMLLFLDNCEHHVTPCAEVAHALLRSCTGVSILATSREGLRIAGEQAFVVPPLRTPTEGEVDGARSIAGIESVRLFTERAARAKPGFALTDRNRHAVAEICRRLDGIPLAIELAASRLTALSPDEICSKLDRRFRLLTSESPGTPARHQTLRAAIQWSHEQLTPEEQELFAALAVFSGGWTFESAAAVCGGGRDEFAVLDLFTHLAEKSLFVIEMSEDGASRYRYLETIREYALERLEESGEGDRIRDRHLDHFLALAEEAAPKLTGPQQASWLQRLDIEHENMLAAIRHGEQRTGAAERTLRLTAAIWRFWVARGLFRIGLRTLERVLRLEGARAPSIARAEALNGGGALAFHSNDAETGRRLSEEGLRIFSDRGDPLGMAQSLVALGNLALGEGDYPGARSLYDRALTEYRVAGHRRGMGVALSNSGRAAELQGDLAAASRLYTEGLAALRDVGDLSSTSLRLSSLGHLSIKLGDYAAAREQLMECVVLVGELKEKRAGHFALERSAALLACRAEPREAAALCAAAEALSEQAGSALTPRERSERDSLTERLKDALGADFRAAAEGRALSFESALHRAHASLGRLDRPRAEKTSPVEEAPAAHDPDSTADLLEGIRGGDAGATARLVKRYLPILSRWAHGRLPGGARSLADTDDLVQVALMRGLRHMEHFEQRRTGAFLSYMRQIVRNQIRDEIRRSARTGQKVELSDDLPDEGASPLEEAIGKESLDRYEATLATLPRKQRESIVMRLEMGFTYREIAEALDIPSEEAARVSIRRALERLKRHLVKSGTS